MTGRRKSHLLKPLIVFLAGGYLSIVLGGALFYLLSSLRLYFSEDWFKLRLLVFWSSVGLSVSLLASLTCWPFALSTATLLEHNKKRVFTPWLLKFLSYSSTIPLVVFCFIYIEVIGKKGFATIESFWIDFFASVNLFTQVVAFGLTLVLYPLTLLPFFSGKMTVDEFFQNMLAAVIEFAQVGLMASAIVLGLFLYILPKMILHMRQQLKEDQALRSFDIIKSVGGTPWESIHLTVLQSMKIRFNGIIVYFTRVCFFEGLITYSLLHFFLIPTGTGIENSHWSASLSSIFVMASKDADDNRPLLLASSGVMVVCFLVFLIVENHFRLRSETRYV